MSNPTGKNQYTGKRGTASDTRARKSVPFRAASNLASFSDPAWTQKFGWGPKQVTRVVRESRVILGRAAQNQAKNASKRK